MNSQPHYWALVPAAGSGSRMGASVPKQYLPLAGATVIEHTLRRLGSVSQVAGIVIALAADDRHWQGLAPRLDTPVHTVEGGVERCHSVLNGLHKLRELGHVDDWVLVHDAARPCVRRTDIEQLISTLSEHAVGGLLGLPVADTMKRTDAQGTVLETVSREGLWRALTPQMFRIGPLTQALETALDRGRLVTDEASAMELAGLRPRMVEGHPDNVKITRPHDLPLAEQYLRQQEAAP